MDRLTASTRWLFVLGIWLGYVATGLPALQLATAPAYASPLYVPAGVALAGVLAFGTAALPAIALGALGVNLYAATLRGSLTSTALVLPAVIAAGATLQAALGAWLVRRVAGARLALDEPNEVARFALVAVPLGCVTSATVAIGAFVATGQLDGAAAPLAWWTWWVGDTLGALIAAPITLTLIGQPRADWAHRRVSVGLPLLVATLLLAAAVVQVGHWDAQRLDNVFERDARTATQLLGTRLQRQLDALAAVHGVYAASDRVEPRELARAVAPWLAVDAGITGFGHAARDAGGSVRVTALAAAAAPAAVQPQADLGANAVLAAALVTARRTGQPALSAPLRLDGDELGVLAVRALYAGGPATVAARDEAWAGAVFAVLWPGRTLAAARDTWPAYLQACIVDTDPTAAHRAIAGPAACIEPARSAKVMVTPLSIGSRQWDLRVVADPRAVPDPQRGSALLFGVVGLAAASMLGALLLTVTGRTRRIETAVAERTGELQREVGERKRTELRLRASERRLREVFDAVPVGLAYADLEGRFLQPNRALCEISGYSSDELLRMNATELVHPHDRPPVVEQMRRLALGEIDAYGGERRYLRKDGTQRWVRARIRAVTDDEGRARRTVGVIEDLTEVRRLEEAEREKEAAQASSQAKTEFVSRMSHELRTPLNAMLGFTQLLEMDRQHPLAANQRDWVRQVQQAGWHLLNMINDTLDLSRIESGHVTLQPRPVAVAGLVADALALLGAHAEARGVHVDQQVGAEAGAVLADPTRAKQILTNLLSNAVKYNIEGGRVLVRAGCPREGIVAIDVIDTGLGMSAEQLASLFQPFNRLGRERSGIEGTGIGLVIAQRLAHLMNGSLTAASRPGEGSVFTLELPRAVAGEAAPGDAGGSPAAPVPGYHRRRVEYIEDNETNAEVMRGILAQRPQIDLTVHGLGLDGLAAIRRRPPNLVLLDMHLPDIDGLELLRHLKEDPALATIPVIVVSADATTQRIADALAAGAERYLTKPVHVPDLLQALDELLEHSDTLFG